MRSEIKLAFQKEMQTAKGLYAAKNWRKTFMHLERAHILGQRYAWPHTVNHWWMLKTGFRLRDRREIFGQVVRLIVAGLGSLIGRVPIGNTGGANVGILKVMPIPEDLAAILRKSGL